MNDKPKCPVFGCTIPRGIPHEHPAGVSEVMRDPAAPLNAKERGELMHYRLQESMQPGRKLRDALLMAGELPKEPRKPEIVEYVERLNAGWNSQPKLSDEKKPESKHRSFIRLVGLIALGLVLGLGSAMSVFMLTAEIL